MEQLKGGVWVKASERLPIEYSYVKIKICGIELKKKVLYTEGSFWGDGSKLIYTINAFEWLDESAFDELLKQIAELQAEKEQLMADYMEVQTDLQNKIFKLEKQLNDLK